MKKANTGVFRVFRIVETGKDEFGAPVVRRVYFDGEFTKRIKARNWCRNNPSKADRYIEHPDGKVEPYYSEKEPA